MCVCVGVCVCVCVWMLLPSFQRKQETDVGGRDKVRRGQSEEQKV